MCKLGVILTSIGAVAVLSSVGVFAYNLWDENRAAKSSALTVQALSEQINEYTQFTEQNESPAIDGIEIDGELYIGILSVPILGIELPINNYWSYPKLKESPCRYAGEIDDSLVIAAHNYESHFGNISTLTGGNAVIIKDVTGRAYQYFVTEVTILQATDIDEMINGAHDLTLFTCTNNEKMRVAVRCMRLPHGI